MRLAEWLKARGIRRYVFAELVGTSKTTISALCEDPPKQWPSRDLVVRIREATNGAVTADDFLPPRSAEQPADQADEARAGEHHHETDRNDPHLQVEHPHQHLPEAAE